MKQAIIFGLSTTILAFTIVFAFPHTQLNGPAQIVLVEDGEEVYSSPFFEDKGEKYIWYIKETGNEPKVLEDQSIIDYYNLEIPVSELGNINKIDYEKISAKSGHNVELNMLVNKDGYVKMYEANCPDKVGVKMGQIKDESKVITCVPHKLVVKIRGIEAKGAVDA